MNSFQWYRNYSKWAKNPMFSKHWSIINLRIRSFPNLKSFPKSATFFILLIRYHMKNLHQIYQLKYPELMTKIQTDIVTCGESPILKKESCVFVFLIFLAWYLFVSEREEIPSTISHNILTTVLNVHSLCTQINTHTHKHTHTNIHILKHTKTHIFTKNTHIYINYIKHVECKFARKNLFFWLHLNKTFKNSCLRY